MNEDKKCNHVANLVGEKWDKMHEQSRRVYGTDGLAPTLLTCGGNLETKVAIFDEQNKTFVKDGLCNTLTTDGSSPKHNGRVVTFVENKNFPESPLKGDVYVDERGVEWVFDGEKWYCCRKLTPRECFRLMGVKDADFDKIAQHQSNSKLYHLAGDSICTPVLMAIFGEMLKIDFKEYLWNTKKIHKWQIYL